VSEFHSHPQIGSSRKLSLADDEVHVWRVSLDLDTPRVQSLQRTLASDEQARADRFHFQRDRDRFIVARGLLRVVLARYLGTNPGQLRFCYSSYGKPSLVSRDGQDALSFNVSHSQELGLYAITRNRKIGVDLEYIRTDFACEQIAKRFFSSRENATLRSLTPRLKHQAFFTCWTRKEAYIKARGEGLSLPLDQFDVSMIPGEPALLVNTRGDPQEANHWSLRELEPGPGYVAALAVEGQGWQLRFWQWPAWMNKPIVEPM
jgi:4'-phosphopantetheinyl transferase